MVTLNVNGHPHRVACPDDEPLAYVLRNRLGLPGTRLACGLEQCGACVVRVNGECRYACTLPAADCDGASITTIEGLGPDGAFNVVQRALLDHNAGQCGYCLSGIVVRAADLFDREPHPTPEQIRQALAPHICRCGAHPRVLRALDELAGGAEHG